MAAEATDAGTDEADGIPSGSEADRTGGAARATQKTSGSEADRTGGADASDPEDTSGRMLTMAVGKNPDLRAGISGSPGVGWRP